MMLRLLKLWLLCFFTGNFCVGVSGLDLDEGDSCKLATNATGICYHILKCQYARNLLLRGENPKICGFERLNAIVCCILTEEEAEDVTPIDKIQIISKTETTTEAQTKKNISVPLPAAEKYISRKKCMEYYPPAFAVLVPDGGGGGVPARKYEFKHMVAVGYGKTEEVRWLCGGSLISNQFVLTAAHCLVSPEFGSTSWVRLGDINISSQSNGSEMRDIPVKKIYAHPGYKLPEKHHDIGLIELEQPVQISRSIKPACLDTTGTWKDNLIATGWGRTSFTGDASTTLLKVDLDPVPFEECQKYFSTVKDELQLCAGGGPKKDTCQGDSGGPLQRLDPNQPFFRPVFQIVGITSYGKACGLTKSPGIYTRIFPHLRWIENIVWPSN